MVRTVDYIPTYKRRSKAKSTQTRSKKVYVKDIKAAVRRNLARLEHDTTSTSTLSRDQLINLLELDSVASYRTAGDHVLQKLIHDGVILPPKRRFEGGPKVFDRDDTVLALHLYVGA